MGRKHPDKLLTCLAALEASGRMAAVSPAVGLTGSRLGKNPPQRIKTLFVPGRLLLAYLKGYNGASWIKKPSQDVRIGGGNT